MPVEDIREQLLDLSSVKELRTLFIEGLNFEYRDLEILPQGALSENVLDPVKEMKVIAGRDEFNIILVILQDLLKTNERPIAKQLSRSYYHSLFIFTDDIHDEWHFCNLKHISAEKEDQEEIARRIRPFRRMVVDQDKKVKTISEQLWLTRYEKGDSSLAIHRKMDNAFDVEAVSKQFYKDFVYYYKELRVCCTMYQ